MNHISPDPRTARRLIREAAGWYSQLCSGVASAEDKLAWQLWLAQGWEQQWAWSRVEHLQQQLTLAPAQITHTALEASSEVVHARRRALLKGLGIFAFTMPLAWVGWRTQPWQPILADYSTATGERREWMLTDGTRLVLNTNSVVNVSFDASARTLHLIRGEIYIETGHADPQQRPLIVHTAQASWRALGTQFIVRQYAASTWLGVIQHAVEVTPAVGHPIFQVPAGQQCTLNAQGVTSRQALTGYEASWLRGMLVVTDWRLADLVTELNRYRRGVLRCDPQLANQRISGAFPLDQPDIAIDAIQTALPQVHVDYFTRYWVSLRLAT
ncbi:MULTISPECIES: FecR domain-containing protein [unclassified Methylophilus]|uniref:FecR domain-containing protein n=1 Tax=unclassified Methylophilus TaxID=2630143 RepID=UPI000367428F|nr:MULTISPECIES: FecR domain-containing protein [unclassified Methylophilus]